MDHEIIAHTRPCFDNTEIAAVTAVIQSRMVNQGRLADVLIERVAGLTEAVGGVAVSTATLGLHLALKALDVSEKDHEVIISDYSCRCLYDAVVFAGATPRYGDINLQNLVLSPESVKRLISSQTRAIIVPHLFGAAAYVGAFKALGVPVIEDCAHCLKAEFGGMRAGSTGAYSVYSFEGSKLIAAGEGGVVIARDAQGLSTLQRLRNGIDCAALHYRMSDLVAAVALCQLDKMDRMIALRRGIATAYRNLLEPLQSSGALTFCSGAIAESDCYRFVVLCHEAADLISFANERGVLLRNPMANGCLSDFFGTPTDQTPNAHAAADQAVSLPIYPDLTDAQQQRVVAAIFDFFSQ